jgi:hypothetical protein
MIMRSHKPVGSQKITVDHNLVLSGFPKLSQIFSETPNFQITPDQVRFGKYTQY